MLSIQEITKLITDVFNYYNGKINTTMLAQLEISMLRDKNCTSSGTTRYPNNVVITPFIIYNYIHDDEDVKAEIVETVIHELFHVDQFVMYSMANNEAYRTQVERDVEFMTSNYIAIHLNEIYTVFGVVFDPDVVRYYKNQIPYRNRLYQRKTTFDHICLFIDNAIGAKKESSTNIIKNMVHYVEEVPNSRVTLNINGNIIALKDKDNYIDIEDFNRFVNQYYSRYTLYQTVEVYAANSDTEYLIHVNTEMGSNIMARKVLK